MASTLEYDDTELQRLFSEMDPKLRLKALKGAFRREANRVRKEAVKNLRNSIRSDRDLEHGVRTVLYKRKAAGFRVTVGTKAASKKTGKGERGFHTNRRGLKKPILIWAEDGTKPRYSKTKTRIFARARKGHFTGQMKRYGFMAKTLDETRGSVTESLHNEVINSIKEVAKKHGCT